MDNTGHSRKWHILVAVGVATLLSTLCTSIMNTILPTIEKDLRIPLSQSEWIVLVYLLVLTLLLLPFGRLSDLIGHRTVFLSGFMLFMMASIWCGLAPTFTWLILGRALLAVAGAMLLSVGPAMLTTAFPPNQRGKALGVQAVMTYLGLAVGPVLGGAITQFMHWEYTFYVTIPFALIGFVLAWRVVPKFPKMPDRRLNVGETLLFMSTMAALVLVLNPGVLPKGNPIVPWVLIAIFVGCATMFFRSELKLESPMLDLRLFRVPNFGFGSLGAAINYLCFYLILFLIPFYLDEVVHASSGQTGLYLTIPPVVMAVTAPIAGALADRLGPRILTGIGMAANVCALICFGFLGLHNVIELQMLLLVVGLILAGVGNGAFAAPNNSAIMGAAPKSKQGVASGTLATCRYVGMMAGITLGGSFLDLLMAHSSRTGVAAFLYGLSVTMWVGAAFGVLGLIVTLQLSLNSSNTTEKLKRN